MAGPTKSKKAGRNETKCNRYKLASTQELNKLRRLIRHAKRLAKFAGVPAISFNPGELGKDVAAAYAVINAKVPNHQIKKVCDELHVVLG